MVEGQGWAGLSLYIVDLLYYIFKLNTFNNI